MYTVRRTARAKRMSLTVYPDGETVITAPSQHSNKSIEQFYIDHSSWVDRQRARFADRIVIRVKRSDIPRLKLAAQRLAEERCRFFAARYGYSYAKIAIRAQKRRWGSCSKQGNLSFNYKIALIPPRLAEYVIVHEVCHLGSLDHSPRFWELVEKCIPDYKKRRADLRRIAIIFA